MRKSGTNKSKCTLKPLLSKKNGAFNTVSLGNSFSSKEKQLYKRKASETQGHNQLSQKKKNQGMPPVQLRPGINIYLTTTDICLPIIAWKRNDASRSIQLVPSTPTGHSILFICLSLPVWLCLRKCSEYRVLVVLLQIRAKYLTVLT